MDNTLIKLNKLMPFHYENKINILMGVIALKLTTYHTPTTTTAFEQAVNEATTTLATKQPVLKTLPTLVHSTIETTDSNVVFQIINLVSQDNATTIAALISHMNNNRFTSLHDSLANNGLNQLLIKLADIDEHDSILDPTAGANGFWQLVLKDNTSQKIVLQDINQQMAIMAALNALIVNATDTKVYQTDALADPKYVTSDGHLQTFDRVITMPPFAIRATGINENKFNRFRYGTLPNGNADYAFISNAISSLNETGKALLLMPLGMLYRGGREGKIRQQLVKDNLVEAVIKLPTGLFTTTNIATCIIIFNKDKKDHEMLFINADQKQWKDIQHRQTSLNETGITAISKLYHDPHDCEGIAKVVPNDDYQDTLDVDKYVLPTNVVINGQTYHLNLDKLKTIPTQPLGDLVTIIRGYNVTARHENSDSNVNVIKINNVHDGIIDHDLTKANLVTNRGDYYYLQDNDILLSVRGTIGKTALFKVTDTTMPTVVNSNMIALRVNNSHQLLSEWLLLFLQSPVGQVLLQSNRGATAIASVTIKDIENIPVPMVPIAQQQAAIATYNENNQRLKAQLLQLQQQQRANLASLYQTMQINDIATPQA